MRIGAHVRSTGYTLQPQGSLPSPASDSTQLTAAPTLPRPSWKRVDRSESGHLDQSHDESDPIPDDQHRSSQLRRPSKPLPKLLDTLSCRLAVTHCRRLLSDCTGLALTPQMHWTTFLSCRFVRTLTGDRSLNDENKSCGRVSCRRSATVVEIHKTGVSQHTTRGLRYRI